MSRKIQLASENDYPALHAILVICGEDMHRRQNMNHWYPFRSFEKYLPELAEADVYAIYEDEFLAGTFYLTSKARTWYKSEQWANPAAKALYFGGFGILPFTQGRGLGAWAMSQVDALAQAGGYEALRFDGASDNQPLMRFYEKLGYKNLGLLETPYNPVNCFEKQF